MNNTIDELVRSNLAFVLAEMMEQVELASHYGDAGTQSFSDEMEQIREYIYDADEYGVAYECIVVNAEEVPFSLSSTAAVKLLEVGLIMGFKTERPQDDKFRHS